MSRVLAELLSQTEPKFRLQLQRLEQAAGLPAADIRLMMHVMNETRAKIRDLGLDPQDTTGPELYAALKTRLLADEQRVRTALHTDNEPLVHLLESIKSTFERSDLSLESFVMKQSVMRSLLRKLQPKATMKKLGYRSLDSMLKHEPLPQLLAASVMVESKDWQRKRLEAYRRLSAADFETRKICFLVPSTKQWPKLAEQFVEQERQTVVSVAELGAVVFLPTEHDLDALAITTLLLGLNAINDIRARSSYLKLQQVSPEFGSLAYHAFISEPMTEAELGGQLLPWSMVQWFYGHGHSTYHPDAFEPHVQPEDLTWHEAGPVLTDIHPALEFWQGSELLGMVDDGRKPVSLNLLDIAVSICNNLAYADRLVTHMQSALSKELLARYLHQENLQALMLGKLEPVPVLADDSFDA